MAHRDTTRADRATPAPITDRLVTARETCNRLTISRSTLWRLRRELPPVRITPTRVGYRERDVQAFIDGRVSR